jgi:pimeloyl-ACP methyl ester carboxylesterase
VLSARPVLSIRGGLSDILTPEGVAHMKHVNPNLETAAIENIGHAPALDEPDAWDALLDFLAKVD